MIAQQQLPHPSLQVDGIDVFVDGEGDESIVMIHGWPDTWRLWDAQVAHLRARYRCVRFSLPGFDIAKPRRAPTLAQSIDTIRAIVEQSCPDGPVTLMTHDWGCVFGYEFAMRHPSLVARIIGVDIGDAGSRAHMTGLNLRARAFVVGYQAWLALAWRIGGGTGDRMTKFMARKLRCPSDPQWIGAQMNYPYDIRVTGSHGSYRQLTRFRPACPMLFFYGKRKPFQWHSREWADAIAARPGNLVVGLETGHWVMSKDPAGFNTAVVQWLEAQARQ